MGVFVSDLVSARLQSVSARAASVRAARRGTIRIARADTRSDTKTPI